MIKSRIIQSIDYGIRIYQNCYLLVELGVVLVLYVGTVVYNSTSWLCKNADYYYADKSNHSC